MEDRQAAAVELEREQERDREQRDKRRASAALPDFREPRQLSLAEASGVSA